MLKPIKFTSHWGSLEIFPGETPSASGPKMFFSQWGPRGGRPQHNFLSPTEALAMAKYLETWALEALRA